MLDARAANAFESSARALLIEAGLLGFRPQVSASGTGDEWIGRVDLANPALRIVIECDGFETHGGRDAFVRDLVRFTWLVSAGWRPLRLTWKQVMFEPEWVLPGPGHGRPGTGAPSGTTGTTGPTARARRRRLTSRLCAPAGCLTSRPSAPPRDSLMVSM